MRKRKRGMGSIARSRLKVHTYKRTTAVCRTGTCPGTAKCWDALITLLK